MRHLAGFQLLAVVQNAVIEQPWASFPSPCPHLDTCVIIFEHSLRNEMIGSSGFHILKILSTYIERGRSGGRQTTKLLSMKVVPIYTSTTGNHNL